MLYFLLVSILVAQAQHIPVVVKYVTSNGPTNKSLIYYTENNQLSWNDFLAKPNYSVDYAALTSAGFGINLGFQSKDGVATMSIDVFCDFSKPDSWVKPSYMTDYILKHEQHHFDIAFISTQLFIKKLRQANFTADNYKTLIKSIYEDCEKDMSNMQTKYDDETQHSIDKNKQQEWNNKIEAALAALKQNINN